MDMMDYLYNEEIIMRNHDAQLIREKQKKEEWQKVARKREKIFEQIDCFRQGYA